MNRKGSSSTVSFYVDLIFMMLIILMLIVFVIYGITVHKAKSKEVVDIQSVNLGEIQLINFLRVDDNAHKIENFKNNNSGLDEIKIELEQIFKPSFGRCYNIMIDDKVLLTNAYLGEGFYDSIIKLPSKDGIINIKLRVQKFYFDDKLKNNCFSQFENE